MLFGSVNRLGGISLKKIVHLEQLFEELISQFDNGQIDAAIEQLGEPQDHIIEYFVKTLEEKKKGLAQAT